MFESNFFSKSDSNCHGRANILIQTGVFRSTPDLPKESSKALSLKIADTKQEQVVCDNPINSELSPDKVCPPAPKKCKVEKFESGIFLSQLSDSGRGTKQNSQGLLVENGLLEITLLGKTNSL